MAEPPARTPVPHHYQETDVTCGPAAMKMALDALAGIRVEEEALARHLGTSNDVGTRQRVIARFVDRIGLQGTVRHSTTTVAELRAALARGEIVLVCFFMSEEDTDHYALVVKVTASHVVLHDPWYGPNIHWPMDVFDAHWFNDPAVWRRNSRWMISIRFPEQAGGDAEPDAGEWPPYRDVPGGGVGGGVGGEVRAEPGSRR